MRKIALAAVLLVAAGVFASDQRTYVFVQDSNRIMTGGNIGIMTAVAKTKSVGGNFFWTRIDGREYLIRDAATLAKIDAVFAPLRATDPEMERLHGRMRPIEARERKLDREADELSDRDEDDRALTSAERDRLDDLHRQLRDIEAQLRDLEREEEALDHKRDSIEAEAERQMWRIVDAAIRNGAAQAR